MFWSWDSQGKYTVKSAYKVLFGYQVEGDMRDKRMWNRLWNLKVPGQVKNLMWRVIKDVLPTKVCLNAKSVAVDTKCSVSNLGLEITLHCFWDCSYARLVWLLSGLNMF